MKKFLIFVSFALLVLAGSSRLFAKEQATVYSGASYKIEDPQLLLQKNVQMIFFFIMEQQKISVQLSFHYNEMSL